MQNIDKVNKINLEPEPEEEKIEDLAEIHISWSFIQIVICILAIVTLIAIKELTPKIYTEAKTMYSTLINQTLFIDDENIKIINEE